MPTLTYPISTNLVQGFSYYESLLAPFTTCNGGLGNDICGDVSKLGNDELEVIKLFFIYFSILKL